MYKYIYIYIFYIYICIYIYVYIYKYIYIYIYIYIYTKRLFIVWIILIRSYFRLTIKIQQKGVKQNGDKKTTIHN